MAKALPVIAANPQGALADNAPLILHTRLEEFYHFAPFITDPANVEELHNMRIAAKRLRYTLEIFAPCFSGKEFGKIYDAVKAVQEQIGEIHDADVRGPLLQAFLEEHAKHRPEIRAGLEALIHSQQAAREAHYQTFLAHWNALQKQGFKGQFLRMLASPAPRDPAESVPAA